MLRARLKRAWLAEPALTVWALVGLIAGLTLLVTPTNTLVGSAVVQEWVPVLAQWLWPGAYTLGAGLVLHGLMYGRPRPEAAGLTLQGFMIGLYVYSIVDFAGLGDVFIVASMLTALTVALLSRALALTRLGR